MIESSGAYLKVEKCRYSSIQLVYIKLEPITLYTYMKNESFNVTYTYPTVITSPEFLSVTKLFAIVITNVWTI